MTTTWYVTIVDGVPDVSLGATAAPPIGVPSVEVTEAELQEMRSQLPQPVIHDWEGFRNGVYSLSSWLDLLNARPGLANTLQTLIFERDFVNANKIWARLVALGAISPDLQSELGVLAQTYGLSAEMQAVTGAQP